MAEKWLQVHIVVLVILSTLLLGNGMNSLSVPLVAGSAAVIAFIFTERLSWIHLNRFVANVAAIGVASLAIYRFFQNESGDIKLAAIANLLTYVQVILLFQRKSPRLYWNIWVLSLLQVVVAGALSLHFQVGILFFAFFLVSLSAMTVMAVYVDADVLAQGERKSHPEPATSPASQLRKRTLRSVFESLAEQDSVHVQVHPPQPGGLGRLMKMSWVAGVITIIFAALLFYSIPRHQDAWYGPNYAKRAKVGFSTSVSFDYAEEIRPSNQNVMRVQFFDQEDQAKKLLIEPYFRGITVPIFENNSGGTNWLPDRSTSARMLSDPPAIQPSLPAARPLDAAEIVVDDEEEERDQDLTEGYSLVRQHVELQPSAEFILFSVMPAFKNDATSQQVRCDHGRESLSRAVRPDEYADGPFDYDVAVPLYFDRPFPAIPAQQQVWDGTFETIKPSPREFPSLYEAAATVVTRVEAKENRRLLAYRMSEFLGNNEDFTYTLNYKKVKFDRTLNPIEDFIRNHKTGHCEYYAAALALMLRTVDIPSRLVIGYKGGDYNEMGNYYEVKEKHAHVWVEAYLPVKDCSPRMLATRQASPRYGAWYRLDPTPEADDRLEESHRKGLVDQAGDAISYAQYVWDDYIVGMNSERQQKNLFNPNEGGLLGRVFADEDWQSQLSQVPNVLRGDLWTRGVRVLLLAAMIGGLWGLYRLAVARFGRKVRRRKVRRNNRMAKVVDAVSPWLANLIFGAETSRPDIHVEFYQRFLRILRKQGLTPAGHQTALEFAASVMYRLGTLQATEAEQSNQDFHSESLPSRSVRFSPRDVLEATHSAHARQPQNEADPRLQTIFGVIISEFYRVRFGADSLDSSRAEKVENALKDLESVLALHPARPPNA